MDQLRFQNASHNFEIFFHFQQYANFKLSHAYNKVFSYIPFLCSCSSSIPANSCWSWRRLQDMSWRRLQHVFSVTILHLPRRLEDVLQRRLEEVLKRSWRHLARRLGRRKIVTLKTSWRHVLKTSWRHYGDKQNTYWGYLYLTNLNVYLTNLYFTNLYLTILRRIQNTLIRTQ